MTADRALWARTHSIGLDGRTLVIDLCAKDSRGLDKVAQRYIPHARKVRLRPATIRRTISDRRRSADIRAWARVHGFEVSERGSIPAELERQYAAAH